MAEEADHLALWAEPLHEAYVDETGTRPRLLGPLGRVNIIVGANSAGKSRLLRSLASRAKHVLVTRQESARLDRVLTSLPRLTESGVAVKLRYDVSGNPNYTDVHPSTFTLARDTVLELLRDKAARQSGPNHLMCVETLAEFYREPQRLNVRFDGARPTLDPSEMRDCIDLKAFVDALTRITPQRILIPTLRSAQTLWRLESGRQVRLRDDMFESTFHFRYGRLNDGRVWTGAGLYDDLLNMQCSKREARSKKKHFESFLSRTIFAGKSVELMAELGQEGSPYDAHVNFVLDGTEHELFNVGDGIGGITLLLFPLFNAEDGTWAFVEEPENHLHPAYQRIFVEALIHDPELRKRNLRVFLTTHSNHLLDVAMEYPDDVSVFSLSKHDNTFELRRSQTRDVRLLEALGVRNSSVYLANCSIWVEGPTDVIYVRAFLDVVMSEKYAGNRPYQEDLHYAFLEYGGGLLANYDFSDGPSAEKLNAAVTANRICIIADKDDGKDERKHKPWRERAEASNGALAYMTTAGREIENDLSPELVRKIVAEKLRVEEIPESFKPEACAANEYLGRFLAAALSEHPSSKTVSGWEDESGTLKAHVKRDFAKRAADTLRVAEDRPAMLGQRARAMAERVLAFIESHNRGATAPITD